MKKYMTTLMVAMLSWMGTYAMDYETARERAYYLTDKMAYELNLNDQQYNDAYEINLDYLLSLRTEADLVDVRYLRYRNEDLRHILYDWQWTAFAAVDYLFRPVWWLNGGWHFPVFNYYAHGYYFYHHPRIFWDYRGGHGRYYYSRGFYYNRRPHWQGGLRGMHRTMTGHPNPHGGRYGHPGGRPAEHRGGYPRGGHDSNFAGGHGGHRLGGNGYHFDTGRGRGADSHAHRPGGDNGRSGHSYGTNSHAGYPGGAHEQGHLGTGNSRSYGTPHSGGPTRGSNNFTDSHSNHGGSHGGSNFNGSRGSSFRGSHGNSGATRGSSFGASRNSGGSRGSGRR